MQSYQFIIVLGMAAQQPSVQLELDQRRSCGYKRYVQEDGDISESITRCRYRRRLADVQVEEILSDSNGSEASNPEHTRNFLNEEAFNAKTYQEENLVEAGFQIDVHNKGIIEQAEFGRFMLLSDLLVINIPQTGLCKQGFIGKELEKQSTIICHNGNISSDEFSCVVKETNNVMSCFLSSI